MMTKPMYAFLVFSLATMACGVNINLPERSEPGPLVTEQISVPASTSNGSRLKLTFGAGKLDLSPGAQNSLVEGTATYNYEQLKPVVDVSGDEVEIRMGQFDNVRFPSFDNFRNEWDFQLGSAPMELDIEAGAYDASLELGGLSLTDLSVRDGAANVDLSFSEPNLSEMAFFRYDSGASNVQMEGLANANFSSMSFEAGAGDYTLDFSGDLQRDAVVNIQTGFSNLILVVPQGMSAAVSVESGVSNINAGPGWDQNGNRYVADGSGPHLTIVVEMAAGNLILTR